MIPSNSASSYPPVFKHNGEVGGFAKAEVFS